MTQDERNFNIQFPVRDVTNGQISKLSDEEEDALPYIADEILRYARSCQPLNKEECIKAVTKCYLLVGEKPISDFRFVASPLAGAKLARELDEKDKNSAPFWCFRDKDIHSNYAFYKLGYAPWTRMEGLFDISKACFCVWFFDEACIIVERPTEIYFNRKGELHNKTGPAMRFSDGYEQYHIDGESVNKEDVSLSK